MAFDTSYGGKRKHKGIINAVWRVLQIVAACAVIGCYATDLRAAAKEKKYSDSKWAFAVVVGALSGVTAIVYLVVGFLSDYRAISIIFGWDWILTVFWGIVSGIFASMYITENAEMDSGIKRMKVAAGFDLANLGLWFVSAAAGTLVFFKKPKRLQ